MTIVLERIRNGNGWIAYLEGKRETWEIGTTQEEAIGKLMVTMALDPKNYIFIKSGD